MSKVSNTKAPVPHIVDSHDLMRVPGAHVNNHKDVSVEIKKLSNSLMRYQAVNVNASKSSETVQRRIEKAVWRSNTVKGSEDCEDYDVSQLGGPCDCPHHGTTADEVIKAQDQHLKEMVANGDATHESALKEMKGRWRKPISGMGWYRKAKHDFAGLPED